MSQASTSAAKPPRKLKAPKYQSFRLQKRIPAGDTSLPAAFRLLYGSLRVFRTHWKVLLGIVAVYGVLTVLFVRGLSGGANVTELKAALEDGNLNQAAASGLLFVYLLSTAGNTSSDVAGAYQLVLTLIVSLAIIWTLRQAYAGNVVRIRDGFYRGMYPLVPFVLVLCVIGLQLLPALIGTYIFNTINANGIAATGIEHIAWGFVLFLLVLASLYMLVSSLMALYIVCLPDMQPLAALRSARMLVEGRRFTVMRKIVFLPLVLLVASAAIMIPVIIFAAPAAAWVLFVLSVTSLLVIHAYMYYLYRALLADHQDEHKGSDA